MCGWEGGEGLPAGWRWSVDGTKGIPPPERRRFVEVRGVVPLPDDATAGGTARELLPSAGLRELLL